MLPIGRSEDSRVSTTSFSPGALLITLKHMFDSVNKTRFLDFKIIWCPDENAF